MDVQKDIMMMVFPFLVKNVQFNVKPAKILLIIVLSVEIKQEKILLNVFYIIIYKLNY